MATEAVAKAGFKVTMLKPIPAGLQPLREDALSIEHQTLRHFTEHDLQDKTGQRRKRRTAKDPPKGLREPLLRERFRCGQIERPFARFVHHEMVNGVDLVVE